MTKYNAPAVYENSGYEYDNYVYQYESGILYDEPGSPYGGSVYPLVYDQIHTYTWHLNRLAGTIYDDVPFYDAQGAANIWAGTSGMALVGALNALYETRTGVNLHLDLQGVLNALAGTSGLGENFAASLIAS